MMYNLELAYSIIQVFKNITAYENVVKGVASTSDCWEAHRHQYPNYLAEDNYAEYKLISNLTEVPIMIVLQDLNSNNYSIEVKWDSNIKRIFIDSSEGLAYKGIPIGISSDGEITLYWNSWEQE